MKIILEKQTYKISKIIKPQKGDMIILKAYGSSEKGTDDIPIYTPFYIAYKFYGKSEKTGDTEFFIAYHDDDFGNIQYLNTGEFMCLNYKQYKKIMNMTNRPILSFVDYMMLVVTGENCELGIWEDQIEELKKPYTK